MDLGAQRLPQAAAKAQASRFLSNLGAVRTFFEAGLILYSLRSGPLLSGALLPNYLFEASDLNDLIGPN